MKKLSTDQKKWFIWLLAQLVTLQKEPTDSSQLNTLVTLKSVHKINQELTRLHNYYTSDLRSDDTLHPEFVYEARKRNWFNSPLYDFYKSSSIYLFDKLVWVDSSYTLSSPVYTPSFLLELTKKYLSKSTDPFTQILISNQPLSFSKALVLATSLQKTTLSTEHLSN